MEGENAFGRGAEYETSKGGGTIVKKQRMVENSREDRRHMEVKGIGVGDGEVVGNAA